MKSGEKDRGARKWKPKLPKPGPEVKKLSRFHPNCTWTGTVKADGMGPGSPEMDAHGKATCDWIQGGLWLSCDFEQDQYAFGEKILTWQARWIIGWDERVQEYRAVAVDTNGNALSFRGNIEGDILVMELLENLPFKLRFVWDASNPKEIRWKNEMSTSNGQWHLIEEYKMTPTK